jgi:DNA-binding MarR family transcriptional regulator
MATSKSKGLAGQIGKRRPFDSPEQEAYLNLLRTTDQLSGEFAALYKQYGITDPQYNVLRILRGHGGRVATRQIAAEMVTRQPDITRLIDRLEKVELVVRHRCKEDRRIVWVELTRRGTDLLERLDKPVANLHHRQLSHLGERKLRNINKLLCEAREPKL